MLIWSDASREGDEDEEGVRGLRFLLGGGDSLGDGDFRLRSLSRSFFFSLEVRRLECALAIAITWHNRHKSDGLYTN